MRETLQMLLAEVRSAWRFRWLALALAWLIALAGTVYVYMLPDQYRAEARVSVDTESMLQPLLEGLAVPPRMERHVQMITNTLLRRENLEEIARDTDLMLDATTTTEKRALIEHLRREISISDGNGESIYVIDYIDTDPSTAQVVVQKTLDIFMEEAVGSSRKESSTARNFLSEQVKEYERRLEEAERRLAKFKRDNSDLLPSQKGGYYERLNSTKSNLRSLEEELAALTQRRETLRKELKSLRKGGEDASKNVNPRLQQLDERIQSNARRLDELLVKYTQNHPDVIALEKQLERLREERKKVASENPSGAATSADQATPSTGLATEELQVKLGETNAQIASIKPKIRRRKERINGLESKVDQITRVEEKLKSLTRNYDTTRQQYQQLLTRLNEARLSADADETGGQAEFQVIEPPTEPVVPIGPNRLLFLAVAYAFAMGAAGGSAWLLSKIRPTFLDMDTLSRVTNRPVAGSVSLVQTPTRRRLAVLGAAVYLLAALVLLGSMATGVLFADEGSALVQRLKVQGAL